MHTRIDIIVYIIIPAPVVFPFEGQATSHAAPPVAHRARRGVHPRFYARWRLDQLYSAVARRAPEWFAGNRRTLISLPDGQSVNQVLPLPDGVQVPDTAAR